MAPPPPKPKKKRGAAASANPGKDVEAEVRHFMPRKTLPQTPDYPRKTLPKTPIFVDEDRDTISEVTEEREQSLDPFTDFYPNTSRKMPPQMGQKGTGKKGNRQSRSRNTTPSIMSASDPDETAFLRLPLNNFQTDEAIDKYGSGKDREIPTSRDLDGMLDHLAKIAGTAELRGAICDRGMRTVVGMRKDREEEIEGERRDEESKQRLKKDALDEEERGRNKKASKMKKRKERDASGAREDRPLSHGAHGLAAQDGSHHPERSSPLNGKNSRKMSRERDNDSASSSLSPVAVATPTATGMDINNDDDDDDDSSSDEHQPPQAPAIPHSQTFGDDPNTFPDPTIYEIRQAQPGMSIEELKEIYDVAGFPTDDLSEFIPATPPTEDFSNAKPTNQVQFNTFATYCEPYFRPITEDDLAFLRERGDRVSSFVIPRRGKKHYTEIWAEEDGALSVDTPQQGRDKYPVNQARGDIENMNDLIGETDQISTGPMLARLLSLMRPEHRAPAEEKTNGVNGDVDMNADLNNDLFGDGPQPDTHSSLPPATFMADSNSEAWKKATHPKLDHPQVDERIKQELRHIGFIPENTEPDYDAHQDDEVAARIRHLSARLKEVAIMNGARKARLTDIVKEKMAHQEFNTITEDLDSQVQSAYQKRTRTLGKTKKNKRPGGAGGGSHPAGNTGMARPGIGDNTKLVMERRKKWIETIEPVLDKDANRVRRNHDENSSIFSPEDMAAYIRMEREAQEEAMAEEELE